MRRQRRRRVSAAVLEFRKARIGCGFEGQADTAYLGAWRGCGVLDDRAWGWMKMSGEVGEGEGAGLLPADD
jgi:hypothetical protein